MAYKSIFLCLAANLSDAVSNNDHIYPLCLCASAKNYICRMLADSCNINTLAILPKIQKWMETNFRVVSMLPSNSICFFNLHLWYLLLCIFYFRGLWNTYVFSDPELILQTAVHFSSTELKQRKIFFKIIYQHEFQAYGLLLSNLGNLSRWESRRHMLDPHVDFWSSILSIW